MGRLPPVFPDRTVTIFGLGYVGLTLAVALAEAGFRVHGVEINDQVLDALAERRAHFSEHGLNDRLSAQMRAGRFTAAREPDPAIGCRVFVVTVGTPVGPDKRTRSDALLNVTRQIIDIMPEDSLVILRSTVRVGTTSELVRPLLEASGKPFDLAFCPERTLEGRALAELASLPQIVGGINDHSTFRASQLFAFLTPTIIRVSNAETAEMAKLVNNTQRDLMFAFANEVAGICDAVGISAHEVIQSGNIGYPRASMPLPGPVGGPCLEKDPYILAEGVERYGFTPDIALTARRWNEGLPARTVRQIAAVLEKAGANRPTRIAVTGLAFKGRPETDDLRGTMAIPLIAALRETFPDASIVGWDPVVSSEAIAALGIDPAPSAIDAARGSTLVVFQNNHVELEKLNLVDLAEAMTGPGMIYDFWDQHGHRDDFELAPGIRYAALGALDIHRDGSQG